MNSQFAKFAVSDFNQDPLSMPQPVFGLGIDHQGLVTPQLAEFAVSALSLEIKLTSPTPSKKRKVVSSTLVPFQITGGNSVGAAEMEKEPVAVDDEYTSEERNCERRTKKIPSRLSDFHLEITSSPSPPVINSVATSNLQQNHTNQKLNFVDQNHNVKLTPDDEKWPSPENSKAMITEQPSPAERLQTMERKCKQLEERLNNINAKLSPTIDEVKPTTTNHSSTDKRPLFRSKNSTKDSFSHVNMSAQLRLENLQKQSESSDSNKIDSSLILVTHKVMFTGSGISDNADLHRIVIKLGGSIATKATECSVVVTDEIRRTEKFLCAVSMGLPIVRPEWLKESEKNNTFLNPWDHLLRDLKVEEEFKFSLSKSLKKAKHRSMLNEYVFTISDSVEPGPSIMAEIINNCGGQCVSEFRRDPDLKKKRIAICTKNDRNKMSTWKSRKAEIVEAEAILVAVLTQSFEPEKFKLN